MWTFRRFGFFRGYFRRGRLVVIKFKRTTDSPAENWLTLFARYYYIDARNREQTANLCRKGRRVERRIELIVFCGQDLELELG